MDKPLKYIFSVLLTIYVIIFISFKIVLSQNPTKNEEVKKSTEITNREENKVYAPGEFLPMPKPKPGDWLASFDEPGQTFKQFKDAERNSPDKVRNKIYILPLEEFSSFNNTPSIKMLKEFTEKYFSMSVDILPPGTINMNAITNRINSNTNDTQWHAGEILEAMMKVVPKDAFCVQAITIKDLYPEDGWNFVFGYASFSARVGVFSFARYYPSFYKGEKYPYKSNKVDTLLNKRCCKILSHESGHMFGMEHCISNLCNMNGSNHLDEFDNQPIYMCPLCLKKLQASIGFDRDKRYDSLLAFYQKQNFNEESIWLKGRIKNLIENKAQ